ncbi:DUF2309 domain-containing protein [Thiobacter aerophilum]|uniref:Probable inorganic carbon transporter subunit DabA n=1 Tax=Thiobacter aerophilum TaxID=3121275 RepID=A0ABV0EK15_9BURK
MSLSLGRRLRIRATVHVAGEPIPFFWPMRTFIHHNPLHGLEHLPFVEAVREGTELFGARGYLPRVEYQQALAEGRVERSALEREVAAYAARAERFPGLDLAQLLLTLTVSEPAPLGPPPMLADGADLAAALAQAPLAPRTIAPEELAAQVRAGWTPARPVYSLVDELFGADIGPTLDELVIKSCLDFFDEGQSVWRMPGRQKGLFAAWRDVARHNLRLFLRGLHIKRVLAVDDTPEGIIAHVMTELGVPENDWREAFTGELVRLPGWAGFIRWRAGARHYYWAQIHPADLVDYLAVRLTLAAALLQEHGARTHRPATLPALMEFVACEPERAWLSREFHLGRVLPRHAHRVEQALARPRQLARLMPTYLADKRRQEAQHWAARLTRLAARAGQLDALRALDGGEVMRLCLRLADFERHEGFFWLTAHEARHQAKLLAAIRRDAAPPRKKRPFAQLLFCIDVRSERIRRHLERVGDYQTFGIAGFFGVPLAFIGLTKGSETHLCPVVVTPKNLVLEVPLVRQPEDETLMSVLEQVMHDLKSSVLSPFVTVEAIGLLFGLDLFGKTLAPLAYGRWRKRLFPETPDSRLLLDKLSREQADSIIRSLQRSLIVRALEKELGIAREHITDDVVRELRETALAGLSGPTALSQMLGVDQALEAQFIERLRQVYRINVGYARIQLERLGRIGFTLDEQAHFVAQALRSVGLTAGFSRFVLLVGHGSSSDNNPYESALDCGACGGNHGLVNARVLAQMANKPAVRERLREAGITIADDAWFVPAFHDTTRDELTLHDLELLPPAHLVYLDRLVKGLQAASHLCAQERLMDLLPEAGSVELERAWRLAHRQAADWSQVRPEWGLSGNAAFIIGRRDLTRECDLAGRAFLHSYDWRLDPRGRLLENILAGPLVVGQWINMEHYFSTVDNARFGSGSKVYHNVAGRFGVMTGNLSDLRTGLPIQTVLREGRPYHEPLRLMVLIEAPFNHARRALEAVAAVRNLLYKGWLRLAVVDPETGDTHVFSEGTWQVAPRLINDMTEPTT